MSRGIHGRPAFITRFVVGAIVWFTSLPRAWPRSNHIRGKYIYLDVF
jgi:hypothetical protein